MGFDSARSLRWLADRLKGGDLNTPSHPKASDYAVNYILVPAIREIEAYRQGRPMPPLDNMRFPYVADEQCPGCGLDLCNSHLMDGRHFFTVSQDEKSERAAWTYYDGCGRLWDVEGDFDWRDVTVRCECGATLAIWGGKDEIP